MPEVNFATLRAGRSISAPVKGLRPFEAARCENTERAKADQAHVFALGHVGLDRLKNGADRSLGILNGDAALAATSSPLIAMSAVDFHAMAYRHHSVADHAVTVRAIVSAGDPSGQ